MTAQPIPINTPTKKTPKPAAGPIIALRKVDELPPIELPKKLVDRVADHLSGLALDDGWYELLTYTTTQGATSAATRLSKSRLSPDLTFTARGCVVYVTEKP